MDKGWTNDKQPTYTMLYYIPDRWTDRKQICTRGKLHRNWTLTNTKWILYKRQKYTHNWTQTQQTLYGHHMTKTRWTSDRHRVNAEQTQDIH